MNKPSSDGKGGKGLMREGRGVSIASLNESCGSCFGFGVLCGLLVVAAVLLKYNSVHCIS